MSGSVLAQRLAVLMAVTTVAVPASLANAASGIPALSSTGLLRYLDSGAAGVEAASGQPGQPSSRTEVISSAISVAKALDGSDPEILNAVRRAGS